MVKWLVVDKLDINNKLLFNNKTILEVFYDKNKIN